MFTKKDYRYSRILTRVSDIYLYGDRSKDEKKDEIKLFNFSSYDIEAIMTDNTGQIIYHKLIYPLVINNIKKPKDGHSLRLIGVGLDGKKYDKTFTQGSFKRSMIFINGKLDDDKINIHPTNVLWIKDVERKSDIYNMTADDVIISHKETIGYNWYLIFLVVFTLYVVFMLILLVISFVVALKTKCDVSD